MIAIVATHLESSFGNAVILQNGNHEEVSSHSPLYPTPRIGLFVGPFVQHEKIPHQIYNASGSRIMDISIIHNCIILTCIRIKDHRYTRDFPSIDFDIRIMDTYIYTSGSKIKDHRYMQHAYALHAHIHQDQGS